MGEVCNWYDTQTKLAQLITHPAPSTKISGRSVMPTAKQTRQTTATSAATSQTAEPRRRRQL
jgi:hypothetical protein